jgi:glycosyltransferase involved in cell wall biosynthesis
MNSHVMNHKTISVVVPVFNEESNIENAYAEISAVFKKLDKYKLELIFTDNHSTDTSFLILKKIANIDKTVKVIRFNKNYGFNKSVLTGLQMATGDAAIQIDCDLEDPPAIMEEFIALWEAGHDVVSGVREYRDQSSLKRVGRNAFYKMFEYFSGLTYPKNTGDFRLIDRKVLSRLHEVTDSSPFVRGLVTEMSTNAGSVYFKRNIRQYGKSKFPFRKLLQLSLEAIYAHSVTPLKFATYTGLLIALITLFLTSFYVLSWLISPNPWPPGFATTTILILFGISINALFLGVIGEYIGRIYLATIKKPLVIIEKSLNIDPI